jgi:N-acyl-D-aspartate/D-glutamate deacylase
LAAMSVAGDRPVNWNCLLVVAERHELNMEQLDYTNQARQAGGKVIPLILPIPQILRTSFVSGFNLKTFPGWEYLWKATYEDRKKFLADPEHRARLKQAIEDAVPTYQNLARYKLYRIGETFTPENEGLVGRKIGEIATEENRDPFEVLLDLVLRDDLRTTLEFEPAGNDEESWQLRATVFRDQRTVIGGADAGAHIDVMTSFCYPAEVIQQMVIKRPLLSPEEAINLMTDRPAQLYGLKGRGRLAPGYAADVLVIDLPNFSAGPTRVVRDMPGGAGRLHSEPSGMARVLVNGVEVIRHGKTTGALPGQLLRPGRDTDTLTAAP